MLFNSPEFIGVFLPITLIGFFILMRRSFFAVVLWLSLASAVFYAWFDPTYLLLIGCSIAVNYGIAARIAAIRDADPSRARKLLVAGVAVNLIALAFFKYSGLFLKSLTFLLSLEFIFPTIPLPLAVSFFTFTQVAYLVDVYRREVGASSLDRYALFVLFFPHLIAGPIVHARVLLPQLTRQGMRIVPDVLAAGLTIFVLGLSKKMLLADTIAPYANRVFTAAAATEVSFFEAWGGVVAYALQIYFDFSGYSDMAIGLGLLFGVRFPINFASPYKAANIIEFWRRWHITLSSFLRDYLYVPLGGSRRGTLQRYRNLMITMLLGGLWHGASWTFVFWGGLHGLFLAVNHLWRDAQGRWPNRRLRLPPAVGWWLTFASVCVSWVFFRSPDWASAIRLVRGMAGISGVSLPEFSEGALQGLRLIGVQFDGLGAFHILGVAYVPVLLIGALVLPNTQQIVGYSERMDAPVRRPTTTMAFVTGVLLFLCVRTFFAGTPSEFLYFNF